MPYAINGIWKGKMNLIDFVPSSTLQESNPTRESIMKIIVIGGTGTIGKAVVKELAPRHEVIVAGQKNGDLQVDMMDPRSIEKMYQAAGKFDAVIVTAGNVHFGALTEMNAEHYAIGLQSKLMGQVNIVLLGLPHINDVGSFTLTSGILNQDPIRLGSSASMVNGALDGFVKSAAIEMPRGTRINAVSPTVIAEAMDAYAEYFRGFLPVPAAQAALAYSKSVEGAQTGQVYRVGF
jgi:NAD(P)-dependent dehydrogenase (short-subunit alcohol dehydrogenase family)